MAHPDAECDIEDALAGLPPYDLHNHTVLCGHADDDATVVNMLSRASGLKLQWLGISEHVMQASDVAALSAIRRDIDSLVSMGAQPLFGVEMDIDAGDPQGGWVVPDVQCDYVILSAHGFPQFDLEIPESDLLLPAEEQRRHLALKWLRWYGNAIQRGGFQVMGHPLREAIIMNLVNLNEPEVMEVATSIFRPAADRGAAFELNNAFLGALELTGQYTAYLALVMRLRAMGMKFSRGSDSHGLLKVGAADNIALFARDAQLTASDWFDPASIERPCSV